MIIPPKLFALHSGLVIVEGYNIIPDIIQEFMFQSNIRIATYSLLNSGTYVSQNGSISQKVFNSQLTFKSTFLQIMKMDPDVIFIQDIDTIEDIEYVLTAAHTGHYIFMQFPGGEQKLLEMFSLTERKTILSALKGSLK